MRAKWSAPIRKYWKISEQMMVKYCDLAISLVLCQTKKGEELLKKSNVELFDADITRAIQLNHQLEYPSRIPSSRMFFFENLEKGFDFAMKKILPKEYLKNEIKIILSKVGIRR